MAAKRPGIGFQASLLFEPRLPGLGGYSGKCSEERIIVRGLGAMDAEGRNAFLPGINFTSTSMNRSRAYVPWGPAENRRPHGILVRLVEALQYNAR